MTRVRLQSVEELGSTGQVWIRDTAAANGGAYGAVSSGETLSKPYGATAIPATALNRGLTDTGKPSAIYFGQATAAWTSILVYYKINVAASAGQVTWAEAAVMTGTPVFGAGTTLTTLGFNDISANAVLLGVHSASISFSAVAIGTPIWIVFGCVLTAGSLQLDSNAPDRQQTGYNVIATSAATRPSTMGASTAFSVEANTVNTLGINVTPT